MGRTRRQPLAWIIVLLAAWLGSTPILAQDGTEEASKAPEAVCHQLSPQEMREIVQQANQLPEGALTNNGTFVPHEFPLSIGSRAELVEWARTNDGEVRGDSEGLVAVVVYNGSGIDFGRIAIYSEGETGMRRLFVSEQLHRPRVEIVGPGDISIQFDPPRELDAETEELERLLKELDESS